MPAELLTPEEVGERLGISQRQVYHRIKTGDLKARKYGWAWMISAADVERARETDWYRASKKVPAAASA